MRPSGMLWRRLLMIWLCSEGLSRGGRVEGIRTLEIPAPYYGDRVRRQFPPSSRVLTLIKVRVSSLFVVTPLFPRTTCDTLSSTRC
jgi:hypothetical protein